MGLVGREAMLAGLCSFLSFFFLAVFFSRLWERILFLAFSSVESLPAFIGPQAPTTFMGSNGGSCLPITAAL